jgi:tRNA G10  N-methylase Trm11
MECLLRGWHVLACDASQKAVNGCEKNLEWLRKERSILKKNVRSEVWKQNALTPLKLSERPDVIVTETTLGPSLEKRAPLKEAQLRALARMRAVVVLPVPRGPEKR